MEMILPSRSTWMCPRVGTMWVVVGFTILAPFSASRRWTVEPWTAPPSLGDRIVTFAGLLGRGDGAFVGEVPPDPEPPPHAAPSSATATIDSFTFITRLLPIRRSL